MMRTKIHLICIPLIFAFVLVCASALYVHAQSTAEIEAQIASHNAQIDALNKEIAQYESQLASVTSKKTTLQNELSALDLTRKKVTAQISATRNRIGSLELEIQKLSRGIGDREISIEKSNAGLAQTLRRLDERERQTLVEAILSADNLSQAWEDVEAGQELQGAIRENVATLSEEKQELTDTKAETEEKKGQLDAQRRTLVAQQGTLDVARSEQQKLIAQTKSQESTYQSILSQKRAAKEQFEKALNDLESQLEYTLDPSKIPVAGKGVLRWPLDNVKITQYFGNTPFAKSGAYNGSGHNGIDMAAPVGTPVKASLAGTVMGTGDTDAVRGCYSYGKWVLLKHANGIATLYGHLSQINVSSGQSVSTGSVIGYSGNTGYSTGPHLHFTVYAAGAVQIMRLGDFRQSTTPCSKVPIPVSAQSGYLNPMDYL